MTTFSGKFALVLTVIGCGTSSESRTEPPATAERATCSEANAARTEGLGRGDILGAVKQALPELQHCCKGRAASVYLHWLINCDGSVSNVFVGTDSPRDGGRRLPRGHRWTNEVPHAGRRAGSPCSNSDPVPVATDIGQA